MGTIGPIEIHNRKAVNTVLHAINLLVVHSFFSKEEKLHVTE